MPAAQASQVMKVINKITSSPINIKLDDSKNCTDNIARKARMAQCRPNSARKHKAQPIIPPGIARRPARVPKKSNTETRSSRCLPTAPPPRFRYSGHVFRARHSPPRAFCGFISNRSTFARAAKQSRNVVGTVARRPPGYTPPGAGGNDARNYFILRQCLTRVCFDMHELGLNLARALRLTIHPSCFISAPPLLFCSRSRDHCCWAVFLFRSCFRIGMNFRVLNEIELRVYMSKQSRFCGGYFRGIEANIVRASLN